MVISQLTTQELACRAKCLKLVLTDNDGVLTDAGVYYSERGEELKRFSLRDGMGVERLRDAGIATAIITREKSKIVARRAEKLKLPYFYLGVVDKNAYLVKIVEDTGIPVESIAYIGDDINDLEIIQTIGKKGLTCAPSDAMPQVRKIVHYVCNETGGHGAFRDFAEWILNLVRDGF